MGVWIAAAVVLALAAVVGMRGFGRVRISAWEQGALFVDGGFVRLLPPGEHWYWRASSDTFVTRIATTSTVLPLNNVEASTAEGLPVRLNAWVFWRVTDARASLSEPTQMMVQVAATEALLRFAAGRDLAALMARAEADAVQPTGPAQVGAAEIERISLLSVVLPPEIRRAVTEAERARMEAAASLERARAEQAALRALANAARLLKDNPDLRTLRLLQAVAAAGKGATIVVGDEGVSKLGAAPRG